MADTDALDDLDDLTIVALTIAGEGDDQTQAAQQGIASTIQMRSLLNWQGETTTRGICLHREQYDCWLPGPDRKRIMKPGFVISPFIISLANQVLKQILLDNTNNATHYYDDSIAPPYWTKFADGSPRPMTQKIDALNFYDLS